MVNNTLIVNPKPDEFLWNVKDNATQLSNRNTVRYNKDKLVKEITTISDAYNLQANSVRVQTAMDGDTISGHKAGFTAQSARDAFTLVNNMLFGELRASGKVENNGTLSLSNTFGNAARRYELEVVFYIGDVDRTVTYNVNNVMGVLTHVAMGYELPGIHIALADEITFITSNLASYSYVEGTKVPLTSSLMTQLNSLSVSVTGPDGTIHNGNAREVEPSLLGVVAALINNCIKYGKPLTAGMPMFTGSLIGVQVLTTGTLSYTSEIQELGSINLTITD